ncbi:MAG: sulfurtransferase-like selenium metabolism protein YedF [Deltaproteobacteria bacterium]|nr:sulfurtransferase-like selenium metabolism protein YedF [Deltaproteobacteria bacterium]MBW1939041.1 sulfurtransferase-like selenium metabolism protein YedF [Deltaproteobacteria bacterium]MBW1964256.1 sulfurtransferase-like selenium metabolism protein YedF [Deltaproteobacteria bacterium]MBW2081121.1 sulfurtransferase-like selenium metabolism protein YedF [Deltaproteobacteria bacterium]
MEILNCRGLDCPKPVLRTKDFIEANPNALVFTIAVDNPAAAQNVVRFVESQGFSASLEQNDNDFEIKAERSEETSAESVGKVPAMSSEKTLVIIPNNTMGSGDDVLGAGLMFNFLDTLNEMGDTLWRVVFLNSGIKLAIEGAKTLPAIQQLEAQGVSILVCGTCLTHFDLLDQKRVGETTNMLDIVTSMQLADKVISV